MRLGETTPINLDTRNQILRDIAYGRELLVTSNGRAATAPEGRPVPFEDDQAAYDAAQKAISQTEPIVIALETRLQASPGPYWKDLTQQEKDAFALWIEAAKQLDSITYKHYPSSIEMDVKKAILMVIGVGAIFAPLLFSKEENTGFPFRVLPRAPELPFERAPRSLPVRPEAPALPYRGTAAVPRITTTAEVMPSPVAGLPSAAARPGFTPPPRFSRGFSPSPGGAAAPASPVTPGLPGRSSRPEGERRFIYPKPRPS